MSGPGRSTERRSTSAEAVPSAAVGPVARLFTASSGLEVPRHGHADVHLCIMLEGSMAEAHGFGEVELVAGSARLSPRGDEHRIRFGPGGGTCALLFVPQPFLDALALDPPKERELGVAGRMQWNAVREELADEPVGGGLRLQEAVVEWLTRAGGRFPAARSAPPAWLSRVRELLHEEPEQVTELRDLALEAGVQPAHLTRTFRHHFRCSPSGYLRWRRAVKAVSGVEESDASLAAIIHA